MATRKATSQVQSMAYGMGVDKSVWKRYGEYSETKSDLRARNEDVRYLKANNMVRIVPVDSPEYIA